MTESMILSLLIMRTYNIDLSKSFTYDHRTLKTRLPVRSALFKQRTGGLVVRWVTTSEYPLLYVFGTLFVLPVLALRSLGEEKVRGGRVFLRGGVAVWCAGR